jgi:hypothetical protein
MQPIRIFVGCAANHEDLESQSVLEWSIRKHTSADVEITWMKLSRDPASPFYSDMMKAGAGWNTANWATPFSGFRWAIPALCGFEGHGIYLDSDFIVTGDIAELWDQEFEPGKVAMAKGMGSWRYCCSKWNCAVARNHLWPLDELKAKPESHKTMNARFSGASFVQAFEGAWNVLDGAGFPSVRYPPIKAIHYTSMPHQPQLRYAVPRLAAQGRKHWYDGETATHWRPDLLELFDELLAEATANGYGPERYAQDPIFGAYSKRSFAGRKALAVAQSRP